MSTEPDSPHPEASSESIEDLRSVLAGLEEEMETLESSLSDLGESGEDQQVSEPSLEDLEDDANKTRLATRNLLPREAPEPLYEELGEEESDAIPDAGVVFDLNPKPNPDKVRPRREVKGGSEKPGREKVPRVSKREQKRLAREEKARVRAEAKKAAAAEKQETIQATIPEGQEYGEEITDETVQRSMDELEMENPLPDATFAPNREHSDLVMDRRQRRLEAAAIAAKREREQDEVWDQSELAGEEGSGAVERPFNLPIYLVQATLVSIAALLVVMGVRAAYNSMRDAKDGEEERARSEEPNLRALGLIEAREVVQSYLAAEGWEAKSEFVRKPEEARSRMERYYREHPGEDAAITGVEVLDQKYNSLLGGEGFLIRCQLPNDEVKLVPTVRVRSEAPFFVVDWEVLVDYSDVDWASFLRARKPGSRGIYRIYAAEDDYYAPPFESSAEYLGLKLYSKKREESAYGYVKRGTPHSRELRGALDVSKARVKKSGAGPQFSRILTQQMAADSKDPQATLNAMQAIRDLPEPKIDETDLFGTKNFIKPHLWQRPSDAWAPMTVELGFPASGKNGFLPRLEIVRFLSPNWIVGESRLELEPVDPQS